VFGATDICCAWRPRDHAVRFGDMYRAEGFIVPVSHDETLLVSAAFSTPAPGIGGNIIKGMQRANPFLTAAMVRAPAPSARYSTAHH
jgi:hypothetical protein